MQNKRAFGFVTKTGDFVNAQTLGRFAIKEASTALPDQQHVGPIRDVQEPPYDPSLLRGLLNANTYHARACRAKARDTAGHGFEVQPAEGVEASEQTTEDDATQQRITRWFSQLDPPLSETLFRSNMDYESIGWSAIEIVRLGYAWDGEPLTLTHVPAHTIRFTRDRTRAVQLRGIKRRWFRLSGVPMDVHRDDGTLHEPGTLEVDQRASEIWASHNYSSDSTFYGVPEVIPALLAISGDLSRAQYNTSFFENYGMPAFAVWVTGDVDDEPELDSDGKETGRTVLQAAIEQHFQDFANNPHSTLIMTIPRRQGSDAEVKVEFEKLSTDVREASFRLYRQDNRNEVLTAHGVPAYRAGIAEVGSLGQNVAKETTDIYKNSIIRPRQTTIERSATRWLIAIGFSTDRWQIVLDEIDTSDESHDMTLLKSLFGMIDENGRRAVSVFEVRRLWSERFNLNPTLIENFPEEEGVDSSEDEDLADEVADRFVDGVEKALKRARLDAEQRPGVNALGHSSMSATSTSAEPRNP